MIKGLTENFQDDERYEYIKSKTVLDDGWQTDYTMYYDWEDDKYIFIFGDNDLYDPTNEPSDHECDTEEEANEWFDNYTGFDDEEDFDECYLSETNNNTEEQELAEFLDWLKQEKIPVTDVNKKFKMIHIQNPDDLDMASWYLHDRDYFKKLADFGWMVSAPSLASKKVAKALKMESKKLKEGLRYYVTDDDYIPLHEQPNEGYTELQAIERAQREAERSAKLFNLKVSETAKWYHIMDSNNKIRHDLDTAI